MKSIDEIVAAARKIGPKRMALAGRERRVGACDGRGGG